MWTWSTLTGMFCCSCSFFSQARLSAGSDVAPGAVELPDDVDLDYFDRHDLGRLRRKLRTAVQRFRRERELYLELVLAYIDVSPNITC